MPIEAPLLARPAALSFWGGLDVETGQIIDREHPAYGAVLSGRILCLTSGRGSSSSSSVLAEALRRGTGPAAIVLGQADAVIVTGAIVAQELYGVTCPVFVAPGWMAEAGALDGRTGRLVPRGQAVTLEVV